MEKTQVDNVKEMSHPYTALQLGVWRVLIAKSVVKLPGKDLFSALPLILVFAAEVYMLAPRLVVLFILTKVWSGIQSSLILRTSSHLLTVLETTLVSGKSDDNAIVQAVLVQTLCMTVGSIVEWWRAYLESRLQPKVKFYFEDQLLRANLTQDLPTSQENSNRSHVDPDDVWKSFRDIIDFCSEIFSTVTQLSVVLHLSRSDYGGPIFGALCVFQPLLNLMNSRYLWGKVYLVYSNNLHYLRMRALHQLSTESYRHDVISGNVAEYITKEYTKARNALGEVSDEWAGAQYSLRTTPSWDILSGVIGDLPMIYMAANAILQPSKFSVSSMAILQQTSSSLRWTFYRIIDGSKETPRQLELIKSTYDALKVDNKINDGSRPYPHEDFQNDGMSIDVRDLSFSYPGSKSTEDALTGVSFSIKAGQLVVIVGPNGSGKSTIVKILNRLYDPTSGGILLDGQPMDSYRISDLRQATADLTQDHTLYPLSIRENIGLGHPPCVSDMDSIIQSAKLGGAYDFISKFELGFDTILQPVRTAYLGHPGGTHPLKEIFDKLEKQVDVSGGETQRLVASRTFMRLQSSKIKCVTVDEPSSALDPQGEMDLFQRLRDARAGKTMIFVTHRFGHLTKHADLIICMKNGTVAETGTHEELMLKNCDYAKLYNIQASAFLPEASSFVSNAQVEVGIEKVSNREKIGYEGPDSLVPLGTLGYLPQEISI